jgi:hypothetical protein
MTFTEFIHSHLSYLSLLAYAYFGWIIANYIYPNDPVGSDATTKTPLNRNWLLFLIVRSLCVGILIYFVS